MNFCFHFLIMIDYIRHLKKYKLRLQISSLIKRKAKKIATAHSIPASKLRFMEEISGLRVSVEKITTKKIPITKVIGINIIS